MRFFLQSVESTRARFLWENKEKRTIKVPFKITRALSSIRKTCKTRETPHWRAARVSCHLHGGGSLRGYFLECTVAHGFIGLDFEWRAFRLQKQHPSSLGGIYVLPSRQAGPGSFHKHAAGQAGWTLFFSKLSAKCPTVFLSNVTRPNQPVCSKHQVSCH